MTKSFNSLKPSREPGRKKLKKFAVVDLETNNWKEFVIGGFFDGAIFKTFTTLRGLCEFIDSYNNTTIFAHFGGIFDFLFLLNYYGLEKIPPDSLMMRGSSIFSFKIGTNTFVDSAGIFPFSLEKIAKSLGVEHQKLDIDHSIKKVPTDKKLIKYLKHDCVALYESIQKFFESELLQDVNFKPTVASLSLEVLRQYLHTEIPSINCEGVDSFVRQAYAGGRVEVLRPIHTGSPLHYYDFNSLYPSCMAEMDVPLGLKRMSKDITPMSFNKVRVSVPKDEYFPLLWSKTILKNKIIFPTGVFEGVFPGIELLEAEKLGVKILKVYKGMEFENGGKLFKNYVTDIYNRRKNSNDDVEKVLCKLFLNAGYGRMAIKRERESLVFDDGREGVTPIDVWVGKYRLAKQATKFRGFSNAAIGALVTAHGRIKLHHTIRPIAEHVYYLDTDGFKTTVELPHSMELGELKLEKTENQFCAFTNKAYIFGDLKKMKGFPKEFVQAQTFRDYQMVLEGELSMWSQSEGKLYRVKSTKDQNFLRVSEKTIRSTKTRYDKRILTKTNGVWETKPIHNQMKEMNE